ncbi:MAG: hypothetical protein ACKOEO_05795 [Planctomycetaceae bacterium]
MLRGGSWNNDAANCRTANRNTNDPANRNTNNGFRLALNSGGQGQNAQSFQTEQIVFQSSGGLPTLAKQTPKTAWCW